MALTDLIRKYSVSGPRYTSYPTAPQWSETVGEKEYQKLLKEVGRRNDPLSLYVHIPFCEALCYYCGCNIQITKDHTRSTAYLSAIKQELTALGKLLGKRQSLNQISWGGGTPTFLTIDEIRELHSATKSVFDIAADAEVSIEVDPRVTTFEQLECLRALGFNRVSLGVQDFHPESQKAVNRVQSFELTRALLEKARELGFKGINLDFIYGLPFQSLQSFSHTLDQLISLRPDRIALYNYARLPSSIPHQKILEKFPMPESEERVQIFAMACGRLTKVGYEAIGMDHFALKTDELSRALNQGSLYRNFMGYTVKKGSHMLGVGASAIGELGGAYVQNVREAKGYEERVRSQGLAVFRGCLLSDYDKRRKWVIQKIMCSFTLPYGEYQQTFGREFDDDFSEEISGLGGFVQDGILEQHPDHLRVTALGRLFVRNVAMVFDAYLKKPQTVKYSNTV